MSRWNPIPQEDINLMVELREYGQNRLAEIDDEIRALEIEREQLRKTITNRGIAEKFELHTETVRKLMAGRKQ